MTTKLLSKDELGKFIDGIANRAKRMDSDIQLAGLSSLAHLKAHGDIGFVNRLFLALGKGHRKAALTSWFLTYGSIVANDGADKKEKPFVFSRERGTDVEAASQDPWFDHKPEPAPDETFDVLAALEAVLKRAKGKELMHGNLLAGIQGLIVAAAPATTVSDEAGDDEGDDIPTVGTLPLVQDAAAQVPAVH